MLSEGSNKHQAIVQHLSEVDSILAKVIQKVGAYQLVPRGTGIEFFANTIIGQQVSNKAAKSIISRFKSKFPQGLTPKNFLERERVEVMSAGLSQRKYEYIFDLCSRVQNQQLNLETLKNQTEEDIRQQLKQVKGIGDWTVDMYLMFCLCRLDVFPIKDLVIRKAISHLYAVDSPQEMLRIAEVWQPYRSVVSWYLYQWYGKR